MVDETEIDGANQRSLRMNKWPTDNDEKSRFETKQSKLDFIGYKMSYPA